MGSPSTKVCPGGSHLIIFASKLVNNGKIRGAIILVFILGVSFVILFSLFLQHLIFDMIQSI